MDRAHDLKAALSFHDHPLAKQALERIAELEAALMKIFNETYEGDPVRAIAEAALTK